MPPVPSQRDVPADEDDFGEKQIVPVTAYHLYRS